MSNEIKFLPTRKADQIAFAQQMHDVVSAAGFDPTTIGLTAADVTELGTLLTADQGNHSAINNAMATKKAKTQDMSGPGGSHPQLLDKVRSIANAARVSNASDGVLASMGITRRDPGATPKTVPLAAPEFSLEDAKPGYLRLRFREAGSASPRARAANTIGVQVAVVDAAKPEADGEADTVPYVTLTRSPVNLDSSSMPGQVRLYARWIGSRGQVGAWSVPLEVTVP